MKYYTIILVLALATTAAGQTLRSIDNRVAKLPSQFIVTKDGVKWIQPGLREPILITWDRIDLEALAKEEPKIEEARQKAILTKKDVFISIPPPRNYYKEFLALPVNARFKEKWKAVSSGRVDYDISTNGYIDYNTGSYSGTSKVSGTTSSITKYIDNTRQSLNTTVEGLLLKMSDDTQLDTHKLVNDLRESGDVYQNLKIAFSNLQAAYPSDVEIGRTAAALDRLMAEKTTSVDAMRQLRKFVDYARSKN
jgi:hypothetical protein